MLDHNVHKWCLRLRLKLKGHRRWRRGNSRFDNNTTDSQRLLRINLLVVMVKLDLLWSGNRVRQSMYLKRASFISIMGVGKIGAY